MDKLMEDKAIIKLEKALGADFVNELRSRSPQELENELLRLAKYNEEIKEAKNNDNAVNAAKAQVKELNAPYNSAIKGNKQRREAVYLIMQEKGMNTNS